jgi:carbonic anhydrase
LFLPLARANHTFQNYLSIDDLLNTAETYKINSSENKNLKVVHFADSVRDIPLIHPFYKLYIEILTKKTRGANTFGKEFANHSHRNKYTWIVII